MEKSYLFISNKIMVIISHIIHAVYLHVFSDRANFLSSSRNNQKEIHTHTHKWINLHRYPHFISANTQVRSTLTSSSLKRRHRHSSFYTVQWIISFAPTMMSFCCWNCYLVQYSTQNIILWYNRVDTNVCVVGLIIIFKKSLGLVCRFL